MRSPNNLELSFGFTFGDLYDEEKLPKIHEFFCEFLKQKSQELWRFLLEPKSANHFQNQQSKANPDQDFTENLLALAVIYEDFLIQFFGIELENSALRQVHYELEKIFLARRNFVQRHLAKKFSAQNSILPAKFNHRQALNQLAISSENLEEIELELAKQILAQQNLEIIENYGVWALFSKEGRNFHKAGALFILPQKIDKQNLLDSTPASLNPNRLSFELRDKGFEQSRIVAEANYCIHCHKQQKDSCRTGLTAKDAPPIISKAGIQTANEQNSQFIPEGEATASNPKSNDKLNSNEYKISKAELEGCPLDEKISEMNWLKSRGYSIAALAVAIIDNPMIAATGHRICNDCMRACIFQKQEPVDVPQIETRILKDVLALPFGFEIYSLLTRWNVLNLQKPLPAAKTGKKILVCGLGPAGFTLSHYLLNSGHQVVAIDGLKIEPLSPEISGRSLQGDLVEFYPIKFIDEIYESMASRAIGGFGGVVEYGITARFDKNFLKIIRLLLERRKGFSMFGGLRFGSSITDKIAFEQYGFDHVALCIGAGRPQILPLKNNFASGVRLASDFLMSLQLTGAYQENLFTNLQIRLPIIVIGGGLTAVDAACEAIAYYAIQIKKFANHVAKIGEEKFLKQLTKQDLAIANEFLDHSRRLASGDDSFIIAKILYRKKIQQSPAYRLNHQELMRAIEQGVELIEECELAEIMVDEFGAIEAVRAKDGRNFDCRAMLVAVGTAPNLSPAIEDHLPFEIDGRYFAQKKAAEGLFSKSQSFSVITKFDQENQKAVSFFGDLHPNFEGNVVKAMASAKLGVGQINELLQNSKISGADLKQNFRDFRQDFLVKIERIDRLSEHVVEIFIKAPLIASQSKIGQIFRLQNYHNLAPRKNGQILAMEGVAITALSIDKKAGIISGIVVETGGSTSMIANFKSSEPCVLMGPSGKPTDIPQNEKVVLIGGGRGNQPLTALAEAFTANGCEVIFFAGYRKNSYIVRHERMKKSCTKLVVAIEDELASSGYFQGSVIEAIQDFFAKNSQEVNRVFAIGNDDLMHEVAKLRHADLVPEFARAHYAITSLNAPMQCMLKGVCGQCLQRKVNQKGEVEYFYACANQDQNMDEIDFEHLHARCRQNSLAEKTSRAWYEAVC